MKKLLFIPLLFLVGCVSLESVISDQKTPETKNDYRYFDPASKVRYKVSNDGENLYLTLIANEPIAIRKILKRGLTIYFDLNGKRKRDVFFQYPLPDMQSSSMRPMQRPTDSGQRSIDLKKLLIQVPNNAIFSHSGVEEYVNTFSGSELTVSIKAISNSEIVYMLAIPFTKISSEGFSAMLNLSVGIVSGYFEMPSSSMSNPSGGRSGGGGGRGGGGGGGMSGGGKSKGMSGGNRPGGMTSSAMSTPIKIWFQVDLFE